MKIAVVGSRKITNVNLEAYIPKNALEIVSGGAVGVDSCAAEYAKYKGLRLTEFLPRYESFGRVAPILRNKEIVDYADKVIIFWDSSSRGTKSVIEYTRKIGKEFELIIL